MYYSGYREGESDNPHVENYEIGMAVSSNGIDFNRVAEVWSNPLLPVTPAMITPMTGMP